MKAIDNSALLNINTPPVVTAGFVPALTYAYNSGAKTITVTDASAFPAGDGLKMINVKIHDQSGNTLYGSIAAAAGNTGAIDVSTMTLSKDLTITATVATNKGCLSDGVANRINATNNAGSLGSFTVGQFSTAIG